MGTGWRRAFCTTIPRNPGDSPVLGEPSPSPRKLRFFKSSSFGSNPSTPRNWSLRSKSINSNNNDNDNDNDTTTTATTTAGLRLRPKTNVDNDTKFHSSVIDNLNITPRLRCKTKTKNNIKSNPSSPRSPFSIFKSSLGFSRSNCGLCLQSVKTGHKTAIFTAECSHAFHFPCISNHVRLEKALVCPVCKSTWKDASFLSIDHNQNTIQPNKLSEAKSRPYNDDEPLRTPRGIAPIAESLEEEEFDDEEFKGFFSTPVCSSSAEQTGVLKNVEVMLMSEVAVISSTETHEMYAVVLKVKAPPPARVLNQSLSTRAPIDLVAVLDVSASMGGAKLQMLKRAMRLVISSLGSADRLAIVAFSACPKRVLPLKRMTARGQRSARRIIDQLAVSRGTCAGEALRKATKVLEDRRERNPVASIILLSDGHEDHPTDANTNTNTNTTRQQANHVSSTRFAHVEIPVHTLEKTGDGYSYESNEPAENAFTKCVGGLLSVVAQDLRVELCVAPGSDPAEITAVYSCNGKPVVLNPGSVRFGDLYAEEEREVLVEMRVPRSSNNGSHHHVLSARCCYNDPATQQVIYGGEKALLVPRAETVRSKKPLYCYKSRG